MNEVKCKALVRTCRKCGRKFGAEDGEVCPDCGESRGCENAPVFGYEYCSNHGGPAPGRGYYGAGAPLKNGSRSSFPIARLASKYMDVQKDGRLLSNRHSIEIIRTRIQQLAERIDMNEAPDRLEKIQQLWIRYRQAYDVGADADGRVIMKQLDDEFEAAYHDYAAWKQMFEAVELDSKMVQSEVKILKDLKAIVTVEDMMTMTAQLMAAMLRVLEDDPGKVKQVRYEFARIIGDVSDDAAAQYDSYDGRRGGEIIDAE